MGHHPASHLLTWFCGALLLFSGVVSATTQCESQAALVKSAIDPILAPWKLPAADYRCGEKDTVVGIYVNGRNIVQLATSQAANPSALSFAAEEVIAQVKGHYYGVSGEVNDHTNTRHTDTPFVVSDTAPDLTIQCYVDFSVFVPAGRTNSSVVNARCNGPLTVLQCTEVYCVVVCGGLGWQHYIDLYAPPENHVLRNPVIFTINRIPNGTLDSDTVEGFVLPKCDIIWFDRWTSASTKGTRMIAHKYPQYYNVSKVDAWTRPANGCGFGPISLTDDGNLFVPDSCPAYLFETENYLAGLPNAQFPELKGYEQEIGTVVQVNVTLADGSIVLTDKLFTCAQVDCAGLETITWPKIDETRGINNNNRHHASANVYRYKLTPGGVGTLVDAFLFADVGFGNRNMTRTAFDEHSRGMFQQYAGGRRIEIAQCEAPEFQDFRVLITQSSFMDTLRSDKWLYTDGDNIRIQAGILSGNIPFRRNRVSAFKFFTNSTISHWQTHYNTPEWVYKGQVNPYNSSHIFASDWEAMQVWYESDGFWTPGVFVNTTDCTIIVAASNGHAMPEIAIKKALSASAPPDEKGGKCLARQPWYQFMYDLAKDGSKNAQAHRRWGNDKYATTKCRTDALKQLPTWASYDSKYLANGWFKIDLMTATIVAENRDNPLDVFVAVSWSWGLPANQIPRKVKFGLAAEGNDGDAHAVMHLKEANKFAAFTKAGTLHVMNTQTLKTECHMQLANPTSSGSLNYAFTSTDGRNAFVAVMSNNAFGPGFGNIMHNTTYSASDDEPTVVPTDPFADGLLDFGLPVDDSLDPGLPRVRTIDYRAFILQRVDLLACQKTGSRTISQPEDDPQDGQYIPFSVSLSSNGDLVCVAGGFSSEVQCYDAITMALRFRINLFDILNRTTELPPFRTFIFINTAPIIVGNTLYVIATEGFFSGVTPGRFLIAIDIRYPANYTITKVSGNVEHVRNLNANVPAPRVLNALESRAAIRKALQEIHG